VKFGTETGHNHSITSVKYCLQANNENMATVRNFEVRGIDAVRVKFVPLYKTVVVVENPIL